MTTDIMTLRSKTGRTPQGLDESLQQRSMSPRFLDRRADKTIYLVRDLNVELEDVASSQMRVFDGLWREWNNVPFHCCLGKNNILPTKQNRSCVLTQVQHNIDVLDPSGQTATQGAT